MNALEHQLDYPLGDTLPAGGIRHQVAPGIYWLRMPLPFALDHINLWLLRDRQDGQDGWTIVDCGINHEAIRAYWETLFADGLDGLPVLRVLVTHCHPDHVGLSRWLCEGGDHQRWNVRLWMSLGDYAFARMLVGGTGASNAGGESAARHFARHGLTDAEAVERIRNRKDYYSTLVPGVPEQYRRIMDGQVIAIGPHRWRVITGFGHAPEHVALYSEDAGVLISGDMVLPRISTNVSVFDIEPETDPLTLYLTSLDKYEALPEDVLILPSHGRPFRGLHTRIRQLRDHHADRLADTLAACRRAPSSARDIVDVIFKRQFDVHQMTFAMGEALAHLHALWHRGEVVRAPGADGIIRFHAPA
ncbi:MBL fold metallo-hydrolase [Ralstonia pseudosolanacearum]|uniref:MBL fold metallo-hydrolase n=1 Tax=Ralstonia pseudosolanacearum TaxID=1310165 RepID=UPI0018A3C3FF|nr:MBL fold metallo-hydrolase [Ralstonia pseudosolanacearum]BCL93548.1 MBL fold hydrolase [Ralstonia solanacearum]BCL96124.1 MBL fold hydrolase [Ralstonia solanacearum]BCM11438.1 MBL fold hydrolase [Ralstonia solanacearum]BCN06114.1 MBL fold hydrolase [Ralstonia solanacearum]